jgi:hypothetical protein|tara:strand:+ start:143 stop:499 length:357 start_codon:yes stop_codon:yes gene_type:complete
MEKQLMMGGRGSVTQLGGVQLDADRRSLASFFVNLPLSSETMVHITRDRMTRLGRIASLLSVDSLRDAADLMQDWKTLEEDSGVQTGKSRGGISTADARTLLKLRGDLSDSAIVAEIV